MQQQRTMPTEARVVSQRRGVLSDKPAAVTFAATSVGTFGRVYLPPMALLPLPDLRLVPRVHDALAHCATAVTRSGPILALGRQPLADIADLTEIQKRVWRLLLHFVTASGLTTRLKEGRSRSPGTSMMEK